MDDILSKGTQRFPMAVIDGMDARRRQHLISGKYLEKKKKKPRQWTNFPSPDKCHWDEACVCHDPAWIPRFDADLSAQKKEKQRKEGNFSEEMYAPPSFNRPTTDSLINQGGLFSAAAADS